MVIGDGMIASAFIRSGAENWRCIIFASGVSNSLETDPEEYIKEEELLLSMKGSALKLVYFSTVSVFDPSMNRNPYILHKKRLETLIEDNFNNFLIIRLPIVVGKSTNPHTLINFLYNSIISGEKFQVYQNASRYLLDLDDVVKLTKLLIDKSTANLNVNLVFDDKTSVNEIVQILMKISGKTGNYSLVQKGSDYEIDNSTAKAIIGEEYFQITPEEYNYNLLHKYYGDL
jgi:nucleoside-diphosphate-sugar epimerase